MPAVPLAHHCCPHSRPEPTHPGSLDHKTHLAPQSPFYWAPLWVSDSTCFNLWMMDDGLRGDGRGSVHLYKSVQKSPKGRRSKKHMENKQRVAKPCTAICIKLLIEVSIFIFKIEFKNSDFLGLASVLGNVFLGILLVDVVTKVGCLGGLCWLHWPEGLQCPHPLCRSRVQGTARGPGACHSCPPQWASLPFLN